MALPGNFQWLNNIGVLPRVIQEGVRLIGIKEIPGPTSNPEILKFASELGVRAIYKNDDTAWCAVSHNAVCIRAGKKVTYTDKYDYLRALAFIKQGKVFNTTTWQIISLDGAILGDTLIFRREDGGHIGFYIGENATHFYVMGGNQNNMYSFTRVSKHRLVAVRRPKYINMPPTCRKYWLNDIGTPITSNEA